MALSSDIFKWTVLGGINLLLFLASIGSIAFGSYSIILKDKAGEDFQMTEFGFSAPVWFIVLGIVTVFEDQYRTPSKEHYENEVHLTGQTPP